MLFEWTMFVQPNKHRLDSDCLCSQTNVVWTAIVCTAKQTSSGGFAGLFRGTLKVSSMRAQNLSQPLPCSIWKLIIEDRYIDFPKLFASMDPGYDPNDDPKYFGGGYTLIKKDHLVAKRPICTESDCIRVFTGWESGVTILYPYCKAELLGYRCHVNNILRAATQDPITDACVSRRKHGTCSEWGDQHQALDLESCFALLASSPWVG